MGARRVTDLILLALVASMLLTGPATGQVGSGERRVGDSDDPTVASVLISQDAFPANGAAVGAVIATSGTFADALAGSALAGTTRPILFTDPAPAPLRQEVLGEVQRAVGPAQGCDALAAGAFEVAILGGVMAVSAAAEATISDAGYCVARFAGAGREQTAIEIADALISGELAGAAPERVLIARRDNFADAATGGALAAFEGLPLLVTPTSLLHPDVETFLATAGFDEAIILGGTAAISDATADAIGAHVSTVTRVAGSARDATAVAIAEQLWPDDIDTVTLVNGFSDVGFIYAIAAGPLSALERAPQLYTQPDALPGVTIDYLADHEPVGFAGNGGGRGVTQILSGPQSQIAFPPGGGFQGSAVISNDVPFAVTVAMGETSTLYTTPDIHAFIGTPSTPIVIEDSFSAGPMPVGPGVFGNDQRTLYLPTEGSTPTIGTVDVATGAMETLHDGPPGAQIFNAIPSPDGTLVAFDTFVISNTTQIGAVNVLDLTTLELVLQDHQLEGSNTFLASHQVWTEDGDILVNTAGSSDPQVGVVDVTTGQDRVLMGGFSAAAHPLLPIVAIVGPDRDVHVIDLEDDGIIQMIQDAGASLPIWSGDGTSLVVSTGPTALVCPPMGQGADDCDAFELPGGFFGSATVTADASLVAGLTSVDGAEGGAGSTGVVVFETGGDMIATFSSRGPSSFPFGPAMPNICAPPASVPSASVPCD